MHSHDHPMKSLESYCVYMAHSDYLFLCSVGSHRVGLETKLILLILYKKAAIFSLQQR